MFTLEDGREQLYQWDLDRRIIVNDPTICEVHFCNRTSNCSLVVEVKDGYANIPNILLQDARPIRAYAYCEDKYTLTEQQFSVKPRTKPSDYLYEETTVVRIDVLIDKAEQAITTASKLTEYYDTHKLKVEDDGEGNVTIEATVPEGGGGGGGNADLSNYYTKEETDTAISTAIENIDIPDTDLTNYYTKAETDTAIYNSRDSYYLDFSSATATGHLPATADMIEFVTRYLEDKNVCAHIKDSKVGGWEVADVKGNASLGVTFSPCGIAPVAIKQQVSNTYKAFTVQQIEDGSWVYYISASYDLTITTKEYVDNALGNIDIPDSARSVYYLDFSSATTEWQNAPAEMGEFVTRAAANHDVFAYISEKGSTWHFAQIKGLSETSIILQIASLTPNRAVTRAEKYYSYNITKNNDVWQYRIVDTYSYRFATTDYVDTAIANIDIPDVDLGNYYTKAETRAYVNEALGVIENGSY